MASFDQAARDYDVQFTETAIGRMQRDRVWYYLEREVVNEPLQILELNCGTGEDACWLAEKGHQVTATDVSEKMLAEARQKVQSKAYRDRIQFLTLDLNDMKLPQGVKYDLIFSNFAGMNCLDESTLKQLGEQLHAVLKPQGKLITVWLSTRCLWENCYFLLKGKWKKAGRRSPGKPVQVPVAGELVTTWYYPPAHLAQLWQPWWKVNQLRPVGLFLPPSYLQPFFDQRPGWLNRLNKWESQTGSSAFWADYADHFYVQWEGRS